ncbi:MAG TPA: hypothetical protein VMU05_01395 [Dongiaceae bacterium]|nr:hypothetical protein [Dongiaceae bacterium]
MRVVGRFLLAAAVGILVLTFGVLAAMVLGGFAVLERSAAAGNRFLILEFLAIGVLICVPLAIAAASWVLFRPSRSSKQVANVRSGAFLAS